MGTGMSSRKKRSILVVEDRPPCDHNRQLQVDQERLAQLTFLLKNCDRPQTIDEGDEQAKNTWFVMGDPHAKSNKFSSDLLYEDFLALRARSANPMSVWLDYLRLKTRLSKLRQLAIEEPPETSRA